MSTKTVTYEYDLKLTKQQHARFEELRVFSCNVYNSALESNISAYQKAKISTSKYDHYLQVKDFMDEYPGIPVNIVRWSISRVHDAMGGFFKRVKKGDKPGFPRYRSINRVKSFGFNQMHGIALKRESKGKDGKVVHDYYLKSKCFKGKIRINLHRPLPLIHTVLGCVFTKTHKGWKVGLQLKVPAEDVKKVDIYNIDETKLVGIDLGLSRLMTISDGTVIPNNRYVKQNAEKLAVAQQKLSKCKNRKSNRRKKKLKSVQKIHAKIRNSRKTFRYQLANYLAKCYDILVFEDLSPREMILGNKLAKSIYDVAWSELVNTIFLKVEETGGICLRVNPRNTTKMCSNCGMIVPKKLWNRIHNCTHCGLVMDRDLNASINIRTRGILALYGATGVVFPVVGVNDAN